MNGVILSKSDEKCAENLGLFYNENEIVTLDGSYIDLVWNDLTNVYMMEGEESRPWLKAFGGNSETYFLTLTSGPDKFGSEKSDVLCQ